ncbi:hypothetical protein LPA44_13145 [Halobacterium sp. KA-4]|uniref:hypothetical protein n=1 Tax=Halobacterium sp. KA-4 TaxID=2896367 RepID=UPI001E2CF8EC|nr:hypothetical protein [Halobacterium sp. KA-4]MCD2200832.1 hypothetical protein [Halobacterium sp. KA-4]
MATSDDFEHILERAEELDCNTDIEIAFIPWNLLAADSQDELAYHDEVITVQKLAQQEDVRIDQFISYSDADTVQLNSTELFFGGLYVTLDFVRNNWAELVTLIQLIQEHYSRHDIGSKAEISISVEKDDGEVEKFDYEGPIDELDSVLESVSSLDDD